MAGGFLYFVLYVLQQLGVMLGVGAQTVLLCTHLVAVHRQETESSKSSYARAARAALGVGFFLMIVSGAGAVVLHMFTHQIGTILTPAFLFKWALIFVLLAAYLSTREIMSSNVLYTIVGGTWYALFLVHSLAPITTWLTLLELYVAWMVVFAVVWSLFVGLMHWRGRPKKIVAVPVAVKKEIPKTVPPPRVPEKIVPPPMPVEPPPPPPPPVPKPVVVEEVPKAPPAPDPTPVAVAPVMPQPPKISWWARFLRLFARAPKVVRPALPPPLTNAPAMTIKKAPEPVHVPLSIEKAPVPSISPTPVTPTLPVVQPLSLEAHTAPVAPIKKAPEPTPQKAPAEKTFIEEMIDHLHVPALRIMPQRVEDIGKQNRPPVVKLEQL